MWMGSQRFFMSLSGEQFAERWHNVGDLNNKIRTTMPGYDADGLCPEGGKIYWQNIRIREE